MDLGLVIYLAGIPVIIFFFSILYGMGYDLLGLGDGDGSELFGYLFILVFWPFFFLVIGAGAAILLPFYILWRLGEAIGTKLKKT